MLKALHEMGSPPDPLHVSLRVRSYHVTGSSARQVREVMRLVGPKRGGHVFGAFTAWEARWSEGRVDLDISITLPRFRPPPNADPRLVEAWPAYAAALRAHEDGHVALVVAAGRELADALSALPPAQEAAAEALAQRILGALRDREVAYDRETRHGATQGVSFPWGASGRAASW